MHWLFWLVSDQNFLQAFAEVWHNIFGGVQDMFMPLWNFFLSLPGLGDLFAFLETNIGRGPTPL